MRRLLVLLCIFNLLTINMTGQVKFKKGYIVMNNDLSSDTAWGLISCKEYGGVPKNPVLIKYKQDESSKSQVYSVSDVTYFEIAGADAYEKGDVYISETYMSPELCGCNLIYEPPVKKAVWFKVVMAGDNLSLYLWNDKFYTKGFSDEFFELGERDAVGPSYRKKLSFLSDQFGLGTKLSIDILHCYVFEDLKKIVAKINQNKVTTFPLPSRAYRISSFAGVGIGIGDMGIYRFSNWPDILFTGKNMHYLTTGADISATFTTLFIRFGFSYSTSSFNGHSRLHNGTPKLDEYSFTQKNIAPSIGIFNSFWDNGIFSYYGGLIVNQNFSFYRRDFQNIRVNTSGYVYPIQMSQSWRSVGLSAGAQLNNQWDANIQVQQAVKFSTSDVDIFIKSRTLIVSIRYHLKGKEHRLTTTE